MADATNDLSRSNRDLQSIPLTSDSSEMNKRVYPKIEINSVELPEIEEWESGKEYRLKIRVKQTEKTQQEDGSYKAVFEVLTVKEDEKKLTDEQRRIKKIMT